LSERIWFVLDVGLIVVFFAALVGLCHLSVVCTRTVLQYWG
jgi:hypothetical protein